MRTSINSRKRIRVVMSRPLTTTTRPHPSGVENNDLHTREKEKVTRLCHYGISLAHLIFFFSVFHFRLCLFIVAFSNGGETTSGVSIKFGKFFLGTDLAKRSVLHTTCHLFLNFYFSRKLSPGMRKEKEEIKGNHLAKKEERKLMTTLCV